MKRALFSILAVITFACGVPASSPADGRLYVSLPSVPMALEITAPGFAVRQDMVSPDGKSAKLHAENPGTGIVITAFLEPAMEKGDSRTCREHYLKKMKTSPFKMSNIVTRESGDKAILEYMVDEYEGRKVSQRNVNVYISRNGYWMDVHVSKIDYAAADAGKFSALADGVGIADPYQPGRYDFLKYGSAFYMNQDYPNAIKWYRKLYDLEKAERKLDASMWKIMTDNLGMSYGVSGDLAKAKEVYNHAISVDGTYPMFYYGLACCFAEENDLDNALLNLEKAIKFKGNMLMNERFPDPRGDSSFKRYLNDERFKKLVDTIKK